MAKSVLTPGRIKKIEGLDQTIKNVKSLQGDLSLQGARDVARNVKGVYMRGAIQIRDAERSFAPYNEERPANKKGTHLRDAIVAAYGREDKPNVIVTVDRRKAPHAWLLEHGTAIRHNKKGANRGRVTGYFYARKGLAFARNTATQTIKSGLEDIVNQLNAKFKN